MNWLLKNIVRVVYECISVSEPLFGGGGGGGGINLIITTPHSSSH